MTSQELLDLATQLRQLADAQSNGLRAERLVLGALALESLALEAA